MHSCFKTTTHDRCTKGTGVSNNRTYTPELDIKIYNKNLGFLKNA